MIVLDATVVNVALPAIQRQLHFPQASLAWVVNAYLLTFGGLLLLSGRLGDLLGRSRILLTGIAAFVVSSMFCGLAPSALALVIARFVQGASAAMVASMVLGIISPMFPSPRDRTAALSIFAFVAIGGVSLGLVIGGLVTEVLNWHWIFFINVPVGAVVLLLGYRLLPRDPGLGIGQGADLVGAVLITSAPMLTVFGLVNAGSHGWGSPVTLGALAGSALLAGLFVVVEARVATPLVPLRIFRHRNLVSAMVIRTLFPMGGFGFNFLGALYLQHVLGYGPLRTGLAFLPSSAVTGTISLAAIPWMVRRVSLKSLMVAGLVLITGGLVVFAQVTVHAQFVTVILPAMVLVGAGFGLLFMPSVSIAMSDVATSEAGLASGLANVAVQLGASVGVAGLATFSAARTAHLLVGHRPLKEALTSGYRLGFVIAAGCTAASLAAAVILLRSQRPEPVSSLLAESGALAH